VLYAITRARAQANTTLAHFLAVHVVVVLNVLTQLICTLSVTLLSWK